MDLFSVYRTTTTNCITETKEVDNRLVFVKAQDVNINGVLLCWAVMLASLVSYPPVMRRCVLLSAQLLADVVLYKENISDMKHNKGAAVAQQVEQVG